DLTASILHDDSKPNCLNPLLFTLYLFSIIYGGIIRLRNRMYDLAIFKMRKLRCRVISIGNITVGGTGKTPMAIMLANLLKERGYKPAVLSRGYGGKNKNRITVVSDENHILAEFDEAGDEPVLIAKSAKRVPVITGPKRYFTGKYAVDNLGIDVLILDDAFQHRCLFRNIDIVLLDSTRPFGNRFLLPRGPLREPKKALERADIIVLTENRDSALFSQRVTDDIVTAALKKGAVPIFRGYHKPKELVKGEESDSYPLEYLSGKKVSAFAGIAKPESFEETIISLGGKAVSFITFPDHHRYTMGDIEEIKKASSNCSSEIIVTTEKDGIKLIDFPEFFRDIFLLRIEMEIVDCSTEFEDIIMSKLLK
ncbi:MAG: tetraacyldisaccharide 4'-kinase, partial [Syntrophales bacterium]|nr:tetraacyldisaccharide 4'-kinase [Syntrophales bacterium]